jgi:hypothetical protein
LRVSRALRETTENIALVADSVPGVPRPRKTDFSGEEGTPRADMVDPSLFGRDAAAQWNPARDAQHLARMVQAYWQHLFSCAVRDKLEALEPRLAASKTASVLFNEWGLNPADADRSIYLERQLSGEYWMDVQQTLVWAVLFDDVTLLPAYESARGLVPPGAVSPSDEES